MKRSFAYLVLVLVLGLLAAGVVAGRWLLGTPEGARWLLASLSRVFPLTMTAREVEGSAGQDLRLGGVRVVWPEGHLEAERLRLRWQPLLFLSGTVAVKELSLDRVMLQDNAPQSTTAPDLAWPTVTGIAARIDGYVDTLRITGLRYRSRTGPVQDLGDLSAVVTWHDRTLSVGRLSAKNPMGTVTGQVVAGFERPMLRADLTADATDAVAGFRRFTLATRLTPARSPEQMAGPLSLAATGGEKRSATLAGEAGMTRTGFTLRSLRLAEGGRRGTATVDGTITLPAGDPVADLRAKLDSLDLAPETGTATNLSGTVALAGTWRDYRGRVDLANAGKAWRAARLAADVKGTDREMAFSSLAGDILGGRVKGELKLGWTGGFALAGSLQGRGLDPARITPDWNGSVNLDLTGDVRWTEALLPMGAVNLTLRDSRLRGYPLTGALDARSDGSDLRINQLALHGRGFDLDAHGVLRERITFAAAITDLGGLVPDTRGRLNLQGWTRYANDRLGGSITGTGTNLGTGAAAIASAEFTANLADDAEGTLDLRARLVGVASGEFRADAAAIAAAGTLPRHTIDGELRSGPYSAAATLAGGYSDGSWQGRITRLAGRDPVGPWRLTAPANLAVTPDAIALSPLALAGTGGERLELAADLSRDMQKGTGRAAWRELDLARAAPWLPKGLALTGHLSGEAAALLLTGARVEARGTVAIGQGSVRWHDGVREYTAKLRQADASWAWRDTALAGTVSLALAEYGEARGTFRIPLPARLPTALDPNGPLQATLSGELRERGVLALLFPGLVQESHGTLRLHLGVDGTWQAPRLGGTFALADAGAYLPPAGVRLDGVAMNGRLAGSEITIESLRAKSGPGNLTATAIIGLDQWRVARYRGTVTGERFQTVNLPELQMLATPKLTFEGTPAKVAIRGQLHVPELLVTAAETGDAVEASPDVILEGAPPREETEFPLGLDIRIGVTLGDRVIVKAEGIDALLGGNIDLAILGSDRVTSTGAIRVVKGHYSTYGVKLEIVRGRVFYAGGPINRPTLDFLALRTEGDVKAGVTVSGTPDQPVVKLYSEPAMADTEILSYIVLGRPLSGGEGETSLLMQAAGALLSAGQSVSLQDQFKQRLGIDVVDVSGAKGTSYGGYRKITVTPNGATTGASTAGVSETMVTVGKYLTPDLYLSYGRSLFSERNQVVLRYRLTKRLEVETQAGSELGADITYRIDFD